MGKTAKLSKQPSGGRKACRAVRQKKVEWNSDDFLIEYELIVTRSLFSKWLKLWLNIFLCYLLISRRRPLIRFGWPAKVAK